MTSKIQGSSFIQFVQDTQARSTLTSIHSTIDGKTSSKTWTTQSSVLGTLAAGANAESGKFDLGEVWNNKQPFLIVTNSGSVTLTIAVQGSFDNTTFYNIDTSFTNTADEMYSLAGAPVPRYFKFSVTNTDGSTSSDVTISIGTWGALTVS